MVSTRKQKVRHLKENHLKWSLELDQLLDEAFQSGKVDALKIALSLLKEYSLINFQDMDHLVNQLNSDQLHQYRREYNQIKKDIVDLWNYSQNDPPYTYLALKTRRLVDRLKRIMELNLENDDALESFHQTFSTFLKQQGSRYTSTKQQIVNEIFSNGGHFEIDELLALLSSKNKVFARATFYRTVKQLLEANLIGKVVNVEGKTLYGIRMPDSDHDHIICGGCGKIMKVVDSTIDQAITQYCENNGLVQQYRSLHVYVLCMACQSSNTLGRV